MKTIGFIIPNYPNEKRVALLPSDVSRCFSFSKIYVERGFGSTVGIDDVEYEKAGCIILTREEIFKKSDIIFSLKLIQPSDYSLLRRGQILLGWTHPLGSGRLFYNTVCKEKELIVIDLDSTCPKICFGEKMVTIDEIPVGFCSENSYIAGMASSFHALANFGTFFNNNKKVAILSSGNVAQGSFNIFSKLGFVPKMYYRKTISSFYDDAKQFDIIVNGIEMEKGHLFSKDDIKLLKPGCLIIDAAADAGGAFEFTSFTSFEEPIKYYNGVYFYCINNTPTILFKDVSPVLSKVFSNYVFVLDFDFILKKYLGI